MDTQLHVPSPDLAVPGERLELLRVLAALLHSTMSARLLWASSHGLFLEGRGHYSDVRDSAVAKCLRPLIARHLT